jgi:hypothetical protein
VKSIARPVEAFVLKLDDDRSLGDRRVMTGWAGSRPRSSGRDYRIPAKKALAPGCRHRGRCTRVGRRGRFMRIAVPHEIIRTCGSACPEGAGTGIRQRRAPIACSPKLNFIRNASISRLRRLTVRSRNPSDADNYAYRGSILVWAGNAAESPCLPTGNGRPTK